MELPPDDLQRGDRLTQEDIETIFDTGFGYQISGINPRRDSNNQRYVLLFSREGGPYEDKIGQGEFRYIGEGLEGDQSKTSPGNAVLIDAVADRIPIYFFYKGADDAQWEYRGQVRVLDFEREEQGGRDVLVFTLHQLEERDQESAPGLYLIPVSDTWMSQFQRTVSTPLQVRGGESVPDQFQGLNQVRVWGTTESEFSRKQNHIDRLEPGDFILFYHDGDFIAAGRVDRFFEAPEVGEWLWGESESRFIFTLDAYRDSAPGIGSLWDTLGYNGRQVVQGFTRVNDDRVERMVSECGSVEAAVLGSAAGDNEPTTTEIEQEKMALEQAVESEPQLTDNNTGYIDVRRKARDQAFRELVREAYENTCAVCGKSRESPSGLPEVEAAHIFPRAEGGSDDVRNGIALCRLHHWCFDVGWITISDDYTILVEGASDRNGYHEFKQHEGDGLYLPNKDELQPHSMYLKARREL